MHKTIVLSTLPVAALLLSGCLELAVFGSLSRSRRSEPVPVASSGPQAITVTNAYLAGDMGSVFGFDGPATSQTVDSYGGYTSIRLTRDDALANGWAMSIIGINGSVDDPALQPGARLSNPQNGFGASGGYFSVIGCSGPLGQSYTFDGGPDDLQVQVEPGAASGSRRFLVGATYGTASGTPAVTTTTFDVLAQ